MRIFIGCIAAVLLTRCATGFQETHYFKSVNPKTGEAVNFFKITIDGTTSMTKSRYVSGFYNQKAVEYFFNEFRSPASQELRLEPVGVATNDRRADGEEGAFVLILSTNAKAVADTIGEMTDNEALTKAFNRLLRSDDIEAAERALASVEAVSDAARGSYSDITRTVADLDGLVQAGASSERLKQQAVRIVGAIAAALGHADAITSFADAKSWLKFEKEPNAETEQ